MKLDNATARKSTTVYINPVSLKRTENEFITEDRGFETLSREVAGRKHWTASAQQLRDEGYKESPHNKALFIKGVLRASIHWMRDSRDIRTSTKKDDVGNIKRTIHRVSFYTGETAISRWSEPEPKAWLKRG